MVTSELRIIELNTPLSRDETRDLSVGDEVWIFGIIWGVRDTSLIRMIHDQDIPNCDFNGGFFLHTAPSVRKGESGELLPVSVGTTTSMKMDRFTFGCIKDLGAAGIIGKDGLSENTSQILKDVGRVYLSITGGAASLETQQVEAIEGILLEDLMPECVWKFRVKRLGPLIVSMDSHGNSLYRDVRALSTERFDTYLKSLTT